MAAATVVAETSFGDTERDLGNRIAELYAAGSGDQLTMLVVELVSDRRSRTASYGQSDRQGRPDPNRCHRNDEQLLLRRGADGYRW